MYETINPQNDVYIAKDKTSSVYTFHILKDHVFIVLLYKSTLNKILSYIFYLIFLPFYFQVSEFTCKDAGWPQKTLMAKELLMCMTERAPFYVPSHFNNGLIWIFHSRMNVWFTNRCTMPSREDFRPIIVYQGAVAWNGLDNDIKMLQYYNVS